MDYLRSSVNLRAYGQREPLVEYKKEGLRMFKDMEYHVMSEVMSLIENMSNIPPSENPEPILITDTPETHDQEIKKLVVMMSVHVEVVRNIRSVTEKTHKTDTLILKNTLI